MRMNSDIIIPKHIQIETINGVCSARCTMCSIGEWTRKSTLMTENNFEVILRKFIPYIPNIDFLTLHGCGEPLLDKGISEKISIAKRLGFRGTGFATNCTELNPTISKSLIESGLDTIICSIDGIKKETHEAIRGRTVFEEIVSNVKEFIRIRGNLSGNTRVIIRFIRQELNFDEWPIFYNYWNKHLSLQKGDDVIRFDVHNWSKRSDQQSKKEQQPGTEYPRICSYIFERLVVYSNGQVSFCCIDDNGFFSLGSAIHADPIELFNSNQFVKYRKLMNEGKIGILEHCKDCTIPQSRAQKTNPRLMKTG